MSDAIGRTITAIEATEFGDTLLLRLDDGTALEVAGYSYEAVSLEWGTLTPEDLRRRAARRQGVREGERLRRLRDEHYAAVKAARIAEAKATMSPKHFQAWLQDTYGLKGFAKAMHDAFAGVAEDLRRDANRLLCAPENDAPARPGFRPRVAQRIEVTSRRGPWVAAG